MVESAVRYDIFDVADCWIEQRRLNATLWTAAFHLHLKRDN